MSPRERWAAILITGVIVVGLLLVALGYQVPGLSGLAKMISY